MNKLKINNLTEIINLNYPHICINMRDLLQFSNIPERRKEFYPCTSKQFIYMGKFGFFNNGQTSCWADFHIETGYIKIAEHQPVDIYTGWLDTMSFKEVGSPISIYKFMKLKAFW